MKRAVMVSRTSKSGINVYLPAEAGAVLGGVGSKVDVWFEKTADDSLMLRIMRGRDFSISRHTVLLRPMRITAKSASKVPGCVDLSKIPEFGADTFSWAIEDGGVSVMLTQESRLPPPTPYVRRGSPVMKKTTPAATISKLEMTFRERMRLCVAEMNDLLALLDEQGPEEWELWVTANGSRTDLTATTILHACVTEKIS